MLLIVLRRRIRVAPPNSRLYGGGTAAAAIADGGPARRAISHGPGGEGPCEAVPPHAVTIQVRPNTHKAYSPTIRNLPRHGPCLPGNIHICPVVNRRLSARQAVTSR